MSGEGGPLSNHPERRRTSRPLPGAPAAPKNITGAPPSSNHRGCSNSGPVSCGGGENARSAAAFDGDYANPNVND